MSTHKKEIVFTKDGRKVRILLDSIPPEKMKSLREAFDDMDRDNSDSIGIDELIEYNEDITGIRFSREQIIEVYFQDDDNGDFHLSFEEFVAREAQREFIEDDIVIEAFRYFNGNLKKMELRQLKYILLNLGDERFNEEEFETLLRLSSRHISDKIEYENYVKDWRQKLAEINQSC